MARSSAGLLLAIVLGVLLSSQVARAQSYAEDAPIPPGARGEVLELKANVLELNATVLELKTTVLEIRGIAAGLAARVDPLQAALKDLGATVKNKEIKIDLAADVLFAFDKADLRPEAEPALTKVVAILKSYPRASATIDGHTDGKGGDQYNQRLSERRAESVRRWLVQAGAVTRMTSRGWGKRRPVAPNTMPNGADNPEGRQKNRRVEITVRTQ
jgi:outer membrane protein OmpA-like peptidoglycan-associated protein